MPDMAYFSFTNKLLKGETIKIYNYGNCRRDFTYVDDIVEGIVRVMTGAPEKKVGKDGLPIPPYAVYNIGESICWTLSISYKRSWCVPGCCQRILILMLAMNWYPCNQGMFPKRMQTRKHCNGILGLYPR